MNIFTQLLSQVLIVNSIWGITLRGLVWLIISIVIIISVDNPNPEKSIKNLRSNLGFSFIFLTLSGGLIYFLFSFSQA